MFSPNCVVPSPKFHSYIALSLILFEKLPIAVNSIISFSSTSIDPPLLICEFVSISAVTSWHGSKQVIAASQPGPLAVPLLINWKVKHPPTVEASTKPGPQVGHVPEYIPNWSAVVSIPS